MELVILGLIVLFVYLFIRLLANFGAWMSGTRYRAYRQLAARYHGRYESRGISDTPTVSFIHNGSTVRVGLAPTIAGQPDQIPRTRVVARFPSGIPFRLELAPIAARPRPSHRRARGKSGSATRSSTAVSSSRPTISKWRATSLTPHVRWSIANLQRLAPPGGMLVSINPERMLVQVDRNLGSNAEALAYAVQEALALHDGLLEGVGRRKNQGIAIVEQPDAWNEDNGPTICKVCGEPIAAGPVICLCCLQYAPSPRLLGIRRRLFDLRMQRQSRCHAS